MIDDFGCIVGFEGKFDIQANSTSQGLPYDFQSIMHFHYNAHSHNQKSTIIPKVSTMPRTELASSERGTYLDFLHVNFLYCRGMCSWAHLNATIFCGYKFMRNGLTEDLATIIIEDTAKSNMIIPKICRDHVKATLEISGTVLRFDALFYHRN